MPPRVRFVYSGFEFSLRLEAYVRVSSTMRQQSAREHYTRHVWVRGEGFEARIEELADDHDEDSADDERDGSGDHGVGD